MISAFLANSARPEFMAALGREPSITSRDTRLFIAEPQASKKGGGDYFRRRSLFGRPDVIKTACPSLSLAPPRSRISFKGQFPRRPRNNIFSPTIIISCRLTMVSTNFRNSGEFSRRGKTSFLVAASVYIPAPIAAVHRHRRAIAIPILCQTPFFLIWYSRQCHVNP